MNTNSLDSAIATSRALLMELASDGERFSQVLSTSFDLGYDEAIAESLRQEWLAGDFQQLPGVEAIAGADLNGAQGVYASATDTIYLAQEFLETATAEQVASVLLEEIGHGVESRLSNGDSVGDEGEIFSTLARGLELSDAQLSVLRQQNDAAEVVLRGQALTVEQATLTVNSTTDNLTSGDGLVTLREAIIAANNDTATDLGQLGSGTDVITLGAGTFDLAIAGTDEDASATGDLDITSDITIRGAGAGVTTIDANQLDRLFDVNSGGKLTLEDVTITGGFTTGNGGGILVKFGHLVIDSSTIHANSAQDNGGGIYTNNTFSSVTLSNTTVSGNTTQGNGGGIYTDEIILVDSTISGNYADLDGGGIYSLNSTTLYNSTVANNTTQGEGGGIKNFGTANLSASIVSGNSAYTGGGIFNAYFSDITLNNSVVLDNSAYLFGGGIYNRGYSTASFNKSSVSNNFTEFSGAGIFSRGFSTVTLSNSNILANSSNWSGGGIGISNSTINLYDSNVSSNVSNFGGGFYTSLSTATLLNSTVSDNFALNSGGGIKNTASSNVILSNSIISGNSAGLGGGISNSASTTTLSDSIVLGNSAGVGGGIYNENSIVTLDKSTISSNSVDFTGGGIFNGNSSALTLRESAILSNYSGLDGGGIVNSISEARAYDSTVSGNLALSKGGGIYSSFSDTNLTNSTISGNSANIGAGIYNRDSTATFTNSTVAGNSAAFKGGGISNANVDFISPLSLLSTIVGDNIAFIAPDIDNPSGFVDVINSLVEDTNGNSLVNGVYGNIVGLDPQLDPNGLQDNGGLTETIVLLPTSPAIDAGSNPNGLTTDQRGEARTVGAATDIGAVEFFTANVAPLITSAAIANVPENQTFAIDVQSADDNDAEGAGLTYSMSGGTDAGAFAIDANTGVVSFINAPDFEHPSDANGDNIFDIQVTVTDSGGLSDSQNITINLDDLGDFWFTLNRNTNGFGNAEDIVQFDGVSTFGIFFDGSDVGLGGANINAFDIISSTEILMSFAAPLNLGSLGTVDDSDIVKFTATSLGEGTTVGTFELFLDGDTLGLTANGEDIDAITGLPDGDILLSTVGGARWSNDLRSKDEDLVRYDPVSGSVALEFDGSDVGLTVNAEDIDAVGYQNGQLQFSTSGNFSVAGVSGVDEDIFSYTPTSSGDNTSGVFDTELFFEGVPFGLTRDIVGADFSIG